SGSKAGRDGSTGRAVRNSMDHSRWSGSRTAGPGWRARPRLPDESVSCPVPLPKAFPERVKDRHNQTTRTAVVRASVRWSGMLRSAHAVIMRCLARAANAPAEKTPTRERVPPGLVGVADSAVSAGVAGTDQPPFLPRPGSLAARLISPRRYCRAVSSCRSLNSLVFTLPRLFDGAMISLSCWNSARSRFSLAVNLMALSGITPHSSVSLPLVLALLRFLPLGRQNDAVVSLI